MLKCFFPDLDVQPVTAVGFDLDGTLYDEFEFIAGVYCPIAQFLSGHSKSGAQSIYDQMIRRWIQKGSSYPYIYLEAIQQHKCQGEAQELIGQCLDIYRRHKPELTLPARSACLLEQLQKEAYALFLITDGNYQLQRSKIEALQLNKWFSEDNIAISGYYGPEYSKPSTSMVQKIAVLQQGIEPGQVLYIGDRLVDRQMAEKAGFGFQMVNLLFPRGEQNG